MEMLTSTVAYDFKTLNKSVQTSLFFIAVGYKTKGRDTGPVVVGRQPTSAKRMARLLGRQNNDG